MRAHMVSSRRGVVEQFDLASLRPWLDRLNRAGRRIVHRYREIEERLDTIAYDGPDSFTLYFP